MERHIKKHGLHQVLILPTDEASIPTYETIIPTGDYYTHWSAYYTQPAEYRNYTGGISKTVRRVFVAFWV